MDEENSAARQKVVGSLPGKGPWEGRPRQFAELRMMSLKLEPEMVRQLKERAAAENTSVSELCRVLLAKGLKDG